MVGRPRHALCLQNQVCAIESLCVLAFVLQLLCMGAWLSIVPNSALLAQIVKFTPNRQSS